MKFPFISARNVVFKEQVNVSLLAEIRVRLGKILGRSARNEMVFLRFKFHSFVRGRAATVSSASFKDSSVVGQNYQRAHQGCS